MSKIVSAKVIVTCPGRNFVTLKIETADGLPGVGDATLNGRELSVSSYLESRPPRAGLPPSELQGVTVSSAFFKSAELGPA